MSSALHPDHRRRGRAPAPLTLRHRLLQDAAGLERLSQLLLHRLRSIKLAAGDGSARALQLQTQGQAALRGRHLQRLRRRGIVALGTGREQRLGADRGRRRQVESNLRAEGGTVSGRVRDALPAGGRATPPLTCRPLRPPPRRPFRRPGLPPLRSGLSGSGLGLRLKSKPGSGSGARGSGARGSGAGPGASTASSPSIDPNSDAP